MTYMLPQSEKTTGNSMTKIRLLLDVKDASIHNFVIMRESVGHRNIKHIICVNSCTTRNVYSR